MDFHQVLLNNISLTVLIVLFDIIINFGRLSLANRRTNPNDKVIIFFSL